ncbi:MAG: phage major capsid protein [Burkholderiales bacterium]|nr:phage major capsid protein [Burkholderiales bacterium]
MQISDSEWSALVQKVESTMAVIGADTAETKAKVLGLQAELLDLQQRGARKGIGGGSSSGDDDAAAVITAAISQSSDYKALLAGTAKSMRVDFDARSLHRKAAILATSVGEALAPYDRSAMIAAPAEQRLFVRDLIPSVPTDGAATQFVEETSYTNSATVQGGSSPVNLGQGEPKAESTLAFALRTVEVLTVAHYFTVARQVLSDVPAMQQHISRRGIYGLKLEEESIILNGFGNVQGLTQKAATFLGGSTNAGMHTVIRRAITQLEKLNGVGTGIVLAPDDVETLELLEDSNNRPLNLVTVANGVKRIYNTPIVSSNSMTAGNFLLADFAAAARIRDRELAHVEVSLDHSTYRTQNLALILIEERFTLEVPMPNAMIYGATSYTG